MNDKPEGFVERDPDNPGRYKAIVYARGESNFSLLAKTVAKTGTEAEAEKAVEEYWADKPVPDYPRGGPVNYYSNPQAGGAGNNSSC